MSDLLDGARELRQKLFRLEVLLEIDRGGQKPRWFSGKTGQSGERAAAIKRLVEAGLVEPAEPPVHFKLTVAGHEYVQDLRAKFGAGRALDWSRADEVDFSRL